MDFWQGKYETLRLFYYELVNALGFITPEMGEPHEVHHEALARAKQYRKLITDYRFGSDDDDEEDWDD